MSVLPEEEDKNFLNKLIEKSTKKIRDDIAEEFKENLMDDHIRIEEDFQLNNSRDLFSNFINFDIRPLERTRNDDMAIVKDIYQQEHDEPPKTEIKPRRNDLELLTKTYEKVLKTRAKLTNDNNRKKLLYDHKILLDSDDFDIEGKSKLPPYATRILIVNELDKFKDTLNIIPILEDLLDTDFEENIEEFRDELPETQSKIENFRASNRKSEAKSKILSNISLGEVFESTNKKLMTKNDLLLNLDNNIILEEDSVFNLNTLSLLRTNLNLEFPEINEEENSTTYHHEVITNIRNGLKGDLIDLNEITENIHCSFPEYEKKEILSYSFYNLLIIAQNEDVNITQNKYFGDITK